MPEGHLQLPAHCVCQVAVHMVAFLRYRACPALRALSVAIGNLHGQRGFRLGVSLP